MPKKKSYNPFKMLGGYVGAAILFIIPWILAFPSYRNCIIIPQPTNCLRLEGIAMATILSLEGLVLGFLVGWGYIV